MEITTVNSVDIDGSILIEAVKNNYDPEDVFDGATLHYWAVSEGYEKITEGSL